MRIPLWSTGLMAAFFITACGGGQVPQETLHTDQAADSTQTARAKKTKNIFHNIPSPMETAALLKKAGAEYDKNILNDVMHVDNYTAASKQALNLGIYGADLSYASVYNNTHESLLYTNCAQKLAKRLDVTEAFNQSVFDRMEKNQQDRDSLLNIVSETYWNMDGYLKENKRAHLSALMIAGGWVEGLYIATQVCKQHDSPELRQRIAEQKLPLNNLLELIATYSPEEPLLVNVQNDLKGVQQLFANVTSPTGGSTVTQEGGVTVIGGTAPAAAITDDQLKALTEKTAAIRATYIN